MKYEVFVDDNFHYMDEDERYKLGEFDTEEEAIAACKKIVDEFLLTNYEPGMGEKDLYDSYTSFGEDPFMRPGSPGSFSAWTYAKERCSELCRKEEVE